MNQWLSFVMNLIPIVLAAIPKMPVVLVPLIAHAIQEAEQLKGASGADKKAHVISMVGDGISALNGAKGKVVVDPAVVGTVVSPAIDTTIGVINLVHAHAPKA